jgi:hypothetical protein
MNVCSVSLFLYLRGINGMLGAKQFDKDCFHQHRGERYMYGVLLRETRLSFVTATFDGEHLISGLRLCGPMLNSEL